MPDDEHSLMRSLDPDRLAPTESNPAVTAVMREEMVYCLPSTPVDAVAKIMSDNRIDELPVFIDRRVIGYVRVDDVLSQVRDNRLSLAGSDFAVRSPESDVLVADIIRTPAVLVDEFQTMEEVVATLQHQQRTVAVVLHEDEVPIGMVTAQEIVEFSLRTLTGTKEKKS